MATSILDATIPGTFNVTGIIANLQDSANPKLDATIAGTIAVTGVVLTLSRTRAVKADTLPTFNIQGFGVTDIVWGDFPREIVLLDFEPLPIETITIPAWPFITDVIVLDDLFVDALIGANDYPYVTEAYVLEEYDELVGIIIQNPTLIVDLEFQPLPQLNAIVGTDFNLIPLGCLDPPAEYWG